jgi:serine protease
MRSATRIFLSFAAAMALVASMVGAASAAARSDAGSPLAGVEVMGILHGARGDHGKPKPPPSNNNLSSGGGPVQVTPAVYISWWGPEWASGFSTGGYTSQQAQAYTGGFFAGVGGSGWNNVVTQYCQGVSGGTQTCPSGAAFITNPTGQLKGQWNDTTSVPGRPSQSQIAAAAVRLMTHFQYDPNATYLVFTPSGKSMRGFGTQWCAWHSSTSSSKGTVAYGYIPYMPDAGASCGMNFVNSTTNSYGNGYFDGFSIVAGHEYSEAETDPHPSSGWVDGSGAENADKCAWDKSSANISFGGHSYAVQPTWSNASSGCAMSK